jgi:hypothetical protein
MTEVWELEVDFEGTTRSTVESVGLYATEEAAEKAREKLQLESWQWSGIYRRTIHQ